ncbi:hypothetical protein K2173_014032 [Erythroxylum novogranatense]|uniref:CASP-like protein n=1 Tax=Erythroxylum novogranatense TaxID=1862640 RepID=A0AAV8SD44_9ROSI|nr:hypothetical protein K2173_014032 [Erythroxylum novogranatense]
MYSPSPPHVLDSPPESSLSSDHGLSPPDTKPKKPPSPVAVQPTKSESRGKDAEVVGHSEEGGGGRRQRPNLSLLRQGKREAIKRRALLGFRILGFVFCLVSFSVLAADKNQGWALDSFHHYKEFRYCLTVNVIGFVYSGVQAYDLAYSLTAGKQSVRSQLRYLFDFSSDQVLAYLLLSAASSAAFRVEDWESNWGEDKFPTMAKGSVALSLLAFLAFALSSLISGCTLFTPL